MREFANPNRAAAFPEVALGAALLLALRMSLSAAIELPLHYSSNMVLQEGEVTVLYGRATERAKLTGSFRGKQFDSTTVRRTGEWVLQFDARKFKALSPAILELKEEIRGQPTGGIGLTNVAIGRVWWIGVERGVGLAAQPEAVVAITPPARDRIRFLNLHKGAWTSLAAPGTNAGYMDSFALAAARNLVPASGYVGLLQFSPDRIPRAGLREQRKPDRTGVRSSVESWIELVKANVNREVGQVRRRQREELMHAKHLGVVTNQAVPNSYNLSTVLLREDLLSLAPKGESTGSDEERFRELFENYAFEGVIK